MSGERENIAELMSALKAALKVVEEVHHRWDHDMKPGKLLIALLDRSVRYRADITAMHDTIAKFDAYLNSTLAGASHD